MSRRLLFATVALWAFALVACVAAAFGDTTLFVRAWLCSFVFWLGAPLGAVTLVLVHDLTGGRWMTTAQPVIRATLAAMPLATLAGLPALLRLPALYAWTHPTHPLPNGFYLNVADFDVRFVVDFVVWNALAAYAAYAPRPDGRPIAPGLSWISGLGLVALALSTGFAAVDWILSLDPKFWSSIFPYAMSASWFNTGLSGMLFVIAIGGWPPNPRRESMPDLSRLLLATIMFWIYVEFIQYLIVWEENLSDEIPWYLTRFASPWLLLMAIDAVFGFVLPFFILLWGPPKRHPGAVATVCASICLSRVAHVWLLILPAFPTSPPLWLNAAAIVALGGVVGGVAGLAWRRAMRADGDRLTVSRAAHG